MGIDILDLLKGVDLFSRLSDGQLKVIADVAQRRKYGKEENIIHEDDNSSSTFFLIATGEVKVYLSGSDGRETILAFLGPGDFFGEMSLIDGEPRSASVKVTTTSELVVIQRPDFIEKMRQFPDLAFSFLEEFSLRIRKANRQIGSLSTLTVFGRIAGTLINLAEERGVRTHISDDQMVTKIPNKPTQQQLAEMSGTTRETVSRVFNSLKKKGVIAIVGKDILILEELGLQDAPEIPE